MVVAGVDGRDLAVLRSVCGVEVVAAYGEALEADAEELAFDTVLHVFLLLGEDLVEGLLKQAAVEHVVDGLLLASVVHPYVHDTGIALSLAHCVGDVTAALGMLDPEVADGLVGVGEREVSALRVGEGGGVEVELGVVLLAPVHPALEVLGEALVAVDELAAEVAVDLVQVQTVGSRDQALGLEDVGAELVDVAGLAGEVSGSLDASGEVSGAFEAGYVVSLPAVHAEMEVLELLKHLFSVDSERGISFLRDLVSFFYSFVHCDIDY